MKRKSISLSVLLLFAGIGATLAQNLVIRFTDGTENAELLSSLQKLSFADGNLVLTYKSGSTGEFALPAVQKLYFGMQTSVPETALPDENKMYVYPNPAEQEIHLKNVPAGTSMIFIYRMDGKLVMERFASETTELIDISNLQSGFYLLVANNQTVKFIKL